METKRRMLEALHLVKSFQREVIRDLSVQIEPGDTILVLGESGAGKTTLLRLLLGLEKPDSGTVKNGLGKISVAFQENRLLEQFDITDNIRLVSGLDKRSIFEEYKKLLPEESFHNKISLYSGGMKRRAAILRAVINDSQAIFLDEPFRELDEANKRKTMQYVADNRRGRSLLVITHEKSEADFFSPNKIIRL
ncbi:MAG: ATP-binding cassette domain-containing protein [Lachnospiraceae bacterium]|nr:ATP-binding cassette domain-containing protein [Lachnospiraceae bacterium]